MKKFILGGMLFVSGFIWMTILMVLSIYNPWKSNGIDGFKGFLLGTDMVGFFLIALGLIVIGLLIVFIEAGYQLRIPEWMKFNKRKYWEMIDSLWKWILSSLIYGIEGFHELRYIRHLWPTFILMSRVLRGKLLCHFFRWGVRYNFKKEILIMKRKYLIVFLLLS